jgi:hypothetical protein
MLNEGRQLSMGSRLRGNDVQELTNEWRSV